MGAQILTRQRPGTAPCDVTDRNFWLEDSQGYRVDGPGGRIGFVDEVRHDGGDALLAVRAGLLGRRILLFATGDVAMVVPRAKQIHLSSAAVPVGTERAA